LFHAERNRQKRRRRGLFAANDSKIRQAASDVCVFRFQGLIAVLALIQAAGWPIWPLIIASVLSLAIIFERSYTLRRSVVSPANLLDQAIANLRQHGVNPDLLRALSEGSPLGRVLVAGIRNIGVSRDLMKESLEEAGRAVAHDLERYLMALGTIASVAPLMGLLGPWSAWWRFSVRSRPPAAIRQCSRMAFRSRFTTPRSV